MPALQPLLSAILVGACSLPAGILAATVHPLLEGATATAKSGEGDYEPAFVLDGDPATRWSSDHVDDEWLEIAFPQPVALAGLRIDWETAYGLDYDLLADTGDGQWREVARVRGGDGGVDLLHFEPVLASRLRMHGIRRGTGWGFSIWDIHPVAAGEAPVASATEVLDGRPATAWDAAAERSLRIDFPAPTEIGGLVIDWAGQAPAPWKLLDGDGALLGESPGAFPRDAIYLEPVTVEALELQLLGDAPASVAEVNLQHASEAWTPARHFRVLASRAPRGAFPRWLHGEQAFWTLTGLPGGEHESLLDEDGRFEPIGRSYSVTPVLLSGGQMLTASEATTIEQSLALGFAPIPTARWQLPGLVLETTALTDEASVTWVRWRVTNSSDNPRDIALALAARPTLVDPPWQHAPVTEITTGAFEDGGRLMRLGDFPPMVLSQAPARFVVADMEQGDVLAALEAGADVAAGESPRGMLGAAARVDFSVPAGGSREVVACFPLPGASVEGVPTAEAFAAREATMAAKWQEWTGDWHVDLPDPRLEPLIRSNLAYLLINMDWDAIQPGSRNYDRAWIRDGSVSAAALMRFGATSAGANYAKWYAQFIPEDGNVPFMMEPETNAFPHFGGDWREYDAFGQYAFLVRQAHEFTDDRAYLEATWPQVRAAMAFQKALRAQRLTPEFEGTEYHGLLPESNSHEGYFPARHSYWDMFWAIRGLGDAAAIAREMGEDALAGEYLAERDSMTASLLASIAKVQEIHGIDFIAGCAELGDFDATSTAIGVILAEGAIPLRPEDLRATWDLYLEKFRLRDDVQPSTYTPYEVRNVSALYRMGRQEDAAYVLDWLIEDGVRPAAWNHWAEVVHPDPRTGSYIGDMPHTWVGSGFINAVRDMLVHEQQGALVLAAGVPEEWIDHGVAVRGLPTWWGKLSYEVGRGEDGAPELRLQQKPTPPNGFVLPDGWRLVE